MHFFFTAAADLFPLKIGKGLILIVIPQCVTSYTLHYTRTLCWLRRSRTCVYETLSVNVLKRTYEIVFFLKVCYLLYIFCTDCNFTQGAQPTSNKTERRVEPLQRRYTYFKSFISIIFLHFLIHLQFNVLPKGVFSLLSLMPFEN